jgi:uncharacterized protein YheU (UPF0270 family)
MEVPYDRLSRAALQAIVEEFVLREGTEYGEREVPLADKVEQVLGQLRRGEACIVFNAEDETCSIALVPLAERRRRTE